MNLYASHTNLVCGLIRKVRFWQLTEESVNPNADERELPLR